MVCVQNFQPNSTESYLKNTVKALQQQGKDPKIPPFGVPKQSINIAVQATLAVRLLQFWGEVEKGGRVLTGTAYDDISYGMTYDDHDRHVDAAPEAEAARVWNFTSYDT